MFKTTVVGNREKTKTLSWSLISCLQYPLLLYTGSSDCQKCRPRLDCCCASKNCAADEIKRSKKIYLFSLANRASSLYLIETPFNSFANRANPDQALVRAASSGTTLFAYRSMIYLILYWWTTNNFFVLCTNMKMY